MYERETTGDGSAERRAGVKDAKRSVYLSTGRLNTVTMLHWVVCGPHHTRSRASHPLWAFVGLSPPSYLAERKRRSQKGEHRMR